MAFRRNGDTLEAPLPLNATITGGFEATQTPVQSTESAEPTTIASRSYKLEAGPVAGIAVGALLAGALLAGIAFFFLLRRQKKRQAVTVAYHSRRLPHNRHTASSEKSSNTVAHVVASSIDDMLPQPVADDKIIDDLSKIRDSVKNHARTYYHSDPVSASEVNEAALHDIAEDIGISTSLLVRWLLNPSARNNAIRLVISYIILSRCDGARDPSLLPYQLAGLTTLIPGKYDCK
jgi:hypothetical protein